MTYILAFLIIYSLILTIRNIRLKNNTKRYKNIIDINKNNMELYQKERLKK